MNKNAPQQRATRARKLEDLLGCYYIFGTDTELLRQALGRLKGILAETGSIDFDYAEFWAADAGAGDIIASCRTISLGSARRLVIVHNAESLTPTGKTELAQYLRTRDQADDTVLVCVEDKVNQQGRSVLDKRGALYKAVQELGETREFTHEVLKGGTKQWLSQRFAQRDKVVTPTAAALLLDALGDDLKALGLEVDKICLYCEEKKKIDVADMLPVLSSSPQVGVFDLIDAIVGDRKQEALAAARRIAGDAEQNAGIIFLLEKQIRLLLAAKSMPKASASDISSRLGVSQGRAFHLQKQSKHLSTRFLATATRLLAELDYERKSGKRDLASAIEEFVGRLLLTTAD